MGIKLGYLKAIIDSLHEKHGDDVDTNVYDATGIYLGAGIIRIPRKKIKDENDSDKEIEIIDYPTSLLIRTDSSFSSKISEMISQEDLKR